MKFTTEPKQTNQKHSNFVTASMALWRSWFSLKLFLTRVFRMSATGKIFEVGVAFVAEFLVDPQL
jgi:hypothetical protein